MNMHYDLAKTEIATRLHHAETRRSAKHARTQQRPPHAAMAAVPLHLILGSAAQVARGCRDVGTRSA